MIKTFQITISGQVQGVGFRPFVYQLAKQFKLSGSVCNDENGVLIRLTTNQERAHAFLESILENAPPVSNVQFHKITEVPHREYTDFNIISSETKQQINIPLTPDFAICESCKAEIRDESNRRYGYAFTTCTNCGPRYTVTSKFPFERENTTVSAFKMCITCRKEYTNPDDRRFHSQTNSCSTCGIQLRLSDQNGTEWSGKQKELIRKMADLIRQGNILAIKNTNGYLLCCDANNQFAIARLREKKRRPAKPFALLYSSLEQIKNSFILSQAEEHALTSPVAPIVILSSNKSITDVDKESIAPGLNQLGVMLPSSGLLALLMDELKTPIVATSGNIHGSPIISKNTDAIEKLSGVADYFLHHNLEVSFPQDDSVIRFTGEQLITLRRARGLAPNYLGSLDPIAKKIVAMGGHLKSTFTFVPNNHTYISPYFGNLDSFDVFNRYHGSIAQYEVLFDVKPEVVLIDSHPQYQSSILGRELTGAYQAKLILVPHHKAHFGSVLGEHGLFESRDKILGVIWDGTGLGEDKAIWGGEFFNYENKHMNRLGHFEYVDWLAADKMAKEPRLSLLSMLPESNRTLARDKFSDTEWKIYTRLLANNDQKTSSVGRLFDAIASLLDLIDIVSYEGQAAMLLESRAKTYNGDDLIDFMEETYVTTIPTRKLIATIQKAKMNGIPTARIAHSFIYTLALIIVKISIHHNYKIIACSGGVFQNAVLVEKLSQLSENKGLKLKFNRILSSNDENISFGQLCYYKYLL